MTAMEIHYRLCNNQRELWQDFLLLFVGSKDNKGQDFLLSVFTDVTTRNMCLACDMCKYLSLDQDKAKQRWYFVQMHHDTDLDMIMIIIKKLYIDLWTKTHEWITID